MDALTMCATEDLRRLEEINRLELNDPRIALHLLPGFGLPK
jgi:hypothetical protein